MRFYRKPWFKKMLWTICALILLLALTIAYCEHAITSAADGRIYSNVDSIPHNEVGVLLGTGPVSVFGGVNPFYTSRIDAATQLWKAGKIDKILISGNGVNPSEYDEPRMMRDSLIAHGVPDSVIIGDGKGLNTQASVNDVKNIYHLKKFTFISQQFHNERAIYMAQNAGLDAIGYNPGKNYYGGIRYCRMFLRERLSRIKAVVQHILN